MNHLKEMRFFKNVSQALLALETGIQQSRISLIENGLVTPREEERQKIADALGVAKDKLFDDNQNIKD
jgi:transcriptional regulator with XRE-family HTH domain